MAWEGTEDETWRLRTALHDAHQAHEAQRQAYDSAVQQAHDSVRDQVRALEGERSSLSCQLAIAMDALTKISDRCADNHSVIARWMREVANDALNEIGEP